MYCVVIVKILNVCSANIVPGKFTAQFSHVNALNTRNTGNGQLMLTCLFRGPSYIKEGLDR